MENLLKDLFPENSSSLDDMTVNHKILNWFLRPATVSCLVREPTTHVL